MRLDSGERKSNTAHEEIINLLNAVPENGRAHAATSSTEMRIGSQLFTAGTQQAHLYWLAFSAYMDDADELFTWLSAEEQLRAAAYRFEAHRRRFILSHAFLRYVLAGWVSGHPRHVHLKVDRFGKPHLADEYSFQGTSLAFNLSHSETHAVVAVTQAGLVGVDVQGPGRTVDGLEIAKRYFAAEEAAALGDLPLEISHDLFLRLWCCKEAFIKAIGLGLSYPLDRVVVERVDEEPCYGSIEPPYGPASLWSLKTWTLAPGSHIAVAIRNAGVGCSCPE